MNALLHSRYAETFGWMLLHSVWQLALIAGLWVAILAVLRRASANARYLLAGLGLVLMLVVPIVTYAALLPPMPRESVPAPIAGEVVVTYGTGAGRDLSPAAPAVMPPAAPLPLAWRVRSAVTPWLPWAVGGYFLGMAAMLVRLASGYACLCRVVSRGTTLQGRVAALAIDLARRMGVHRTIRVLQSAAIEVPTLLGALKPVILLPASALTGLSADQLAALLAHEMAHIRRHDYVANLAQSFIETLLFYHPAAWWLSARIRHERELCCDDAAIAATSDRLAYARALAAMESLRVPANVALAAAGGSLLRRIRHVLGPAQARAPRRFITTSAAALFVCLLAALAYIGCNRSTSETAKPPATSSATVATGESRTFDLRYLLPPGSAQTKRDMIASIIATLESTVAPDSWKAKGGTGECRESEGRLTVVQTPKNLETVNDHLAKLFETRGLAVALECRAILVSSDFLDDFRIGWNLAIPFEGDPSGPPSNNAAIFDNWTLNQFFTAVQLDRRSISITAPRVTTPNGYPVSADLVLPPASATTAPARVSEKDFVGVHLNLTPTASADRRYVVLEGLRPARISTVPPATAPAATHPAVATPSAIGAAMGRPIVGSPVATTMMSVPDGGTVLINGGPVADGEGKPAYQLLILVRPNLMAGWGEGAIPVFQLAGGTPPNSIDPTGLAPSTSPAVGQVLVKVVIMEFDAAALDKLIPGGATFGIAPRSATQPGGRICLVENSEALSKEIGKLVAAKQGEIIARPYLIAPDGHDAFLTMGQQAPLVRGYYTDPEKGRRAAVDYRHVGTQINVSPKIEKDGLVNLDLRVSISALAKDQPAPDPATGLPPIGSPVLDERTGKAHVAIPNGETLLMTLQPAQNGKVTAAFFTPHTSFKPSDLSLTRPVSPAQSDPDRLP